MANFYQWIFAGLRIVAFERKPEDYRPWICFADTALNDWEEFVVANRLSKKHTSRETIMKYDKYFAIEGRIAQRNFVQRT